MTDNINKPELKIKVHETLKVYSVVEMTSYERVLYYSPIINNMHDIVFWTPAHTVSYELLKQKRDSRAFRYKTGGKMLVFSILNEGKTWSFVPTQQTLF
jgi:hypothetical protein